MKLAKSFADNFYFQCTAARTSKWVADNLKKTSKDAKWVENLETTFSVTERSTKDMVQQTEVNQKSVGTTDRDPPQGIDNNSAQANLGKKKPLETEITTNAKALQFLKRTITFCFSPPAVKKQKRPCHRHGKIDTRNSYTK